MSGTRARSCVIVGLDGSDPDVLANLVLFYSACGFDVSRSPIPVDCDLLVIQRGAYGGEVFEARAAACHIYDYVRMGTSDFHQSFPNISAVAVISPTTPVSGQSMPATVIKSFHPVISELWANRDPGTRRAHRFIHVGHRKANAANDKWLAQMDSVALSGRCHMWGSGWQELSAADSSTIHEPATLHQCQAIYRQAEFAFGVMYPMQRGTTISGRAWQGPLNGCLVYSEALVPDVTIPGVVLSEDFPATLEHAASPYSSAAELVADASRFWNELSLNLARDLDLHYTRPARSTVRSVYAKEIFLRHLNSRTRRILRRA